MSERYRFAEHEEALHERASQAEGLTDFGEPDYLEGMRVFLRALDNDDKLHEGGSRAVRNQILHALRQRLRTEQAWKDNPQVLDIEIRRPIFITGCVRTGSTALHYLMGRDPGIQKLEWWLAASPQPRPPRPTWEAHPDFQAAQAEMDAMFEADPSIKTMHFTTAAGPEECRHFLYQCFTDDAFEVSTSVPEYEEWYHSTRHEHTYRRHRKLVQLVGSTDLERRWLLKYPVHLRQLDVLLAVYPDACIVHTHRDPRDVIPSYCNMTATYRGLMENDIDRADIARTQMRGWSQAANRSVEIRARHDEAQFFDLHFEDYVADPVGSVKRIYEHFDQPLSDEGEQALVQWNRDNPQGKHGKHEYSARGTGLEEREITEAFGPYMEHFGMLGG
jgi:hypothetical protein